MGTTIKAIADQANVSTATVSRVINNNGFVKAETRKRIQEIIQKLNYVPEESARKRFPGNRSSAALKHRNFTLLWTDGIDSLQDKTSQRMMLGLSESAGAAGIKLNVEVLFAEKSLNAMTLKTDGIFLQGGSLPVGSVAQLQHVPVVWLLQTGRYEFGDRVQPDHWQVGTLAYEYLRGKGCTNLCCIGCEATQKYPRYWITRQLAFQNAALSDDTPCQIIRSAHSDYLVDAADRTATAQKIVREILAMNPRPDGIFIANTFGVPICRELQANGLVPFQNIELVVGDQEVCGDFLDQPQVMIDIQGKKLGSLAFETMMWRIQHPDAPQITLLQRARLSIPEIIPTRS